ncbi:MAG TPA: ABC transporter substrate-binding protein [Bradyrhizobium sp.]|jgi:branched-chain amino acid transport system substrate-binding protein|uniref:ABC transporter substrate-binding protein n=1 Tax=Bradyrhizobium sp. TaxID=376 RepID=UPI002BA499A9|nr:ABC transporter substrate-binding protein [Bradyrhizobium sp.]HXB77647.1 ABC transporter substrate-binding protein [Bradyrhizobium sp.]
MGARTILAAAALLLSCATSAQAADTQDVNVILPLTGGGAFLGKAEQQSLQRYEKLVNSTGGIHGKTLKFNFHDDQSSPQLAVQLANQVKAGNPPVILGSALVALCNAMAPLMKEGPLLYCFSPGIQPAAGSFVYSSSTSTKELAGALLRYFGHKGWKKVALITTTDATGQDANRNFKTLVGSEGHKDVELVAEAQMNPADVSAAAQIQRLKGANPDVLVAWSTGGPVGTIFKAIHDAGVEVPVATTNGNMTYAQMTQYAPFLPKELYIPSADWLKPSRPVEVSDASKAKDAFFAAFEGTDIKPDGPSTYAWDPALLVVEALRKLKGDASAEDLRAYLRGLKDFAGVNGYYDFKAVPNRGLDESNVVITRWDKAAQTWAVVSDPLGIPRAE